MIEIGPPEGCPEGMGGRGILGLSPAQRDGGSFRPVGVVTAISTRWRQVPIKPPEDLPPFHRCHCRFRKPAE